MGYYVFVGSSGVFSNVVVVCLYFGQDRMKFGRLSQFGRRWYHIFAGRGVVLMLPK